MYIARLADHHGERFEVRQTILRDGALRFETLADLGPDPTTHVSFSRFGLTYSDELLTSLSGLELDPDALDSLFLQFAPRHYVHHSPRSKTWTRTRLTSAQEQAVRALHPFDRRRLAYLRTGEINLSRINEVHPKMFMPLLGKCRDELEQLFLFMERSLPRSEVRPYIYASFNLQRYFTTLSARSMPEAQDEKRVDEAFENEFCALRKNAEFWNGLRDGGEEYARRYIFLHFDYDFVRERGFGGVFEEFMNDFRRPTAAPKPIQPERVRELFGLGMAEIRALSRREFARIFRKKAMEMHPDKGGDHDTFVELLATYKRLVSGKSE